MARTVEWFANVDQIDPDEVDDRFFDAFLASAPEYWRDFYRAVREWKQTGNASPVIAVFTEDTVDRSRQLRQFLDKNANEDRRERNEDSGQELTFVFNPLRKSMETGEAEDYSFEQNRLQRCLSEMIDGQNLSEPIVVDLIGSAGYDERFGSLVTIDVQCIHDAWSLCLHQIQTNRKTHKLRRCEVPLPRSDQPCGNFIIDVTYRGNRERQHCSERCSNRHSGRKFRKTK